MNVTLHLTTGCNLRCTYCFEGDHAYREDMSARVARAAIDFALQQGGGLPGIVFFGGEPLLRRDLIVESVTYAREAARRVGAQPHFKVTTNGLLLDDALIDFCAREDVAVSLSLDGVREAHDRHRLQIAGQPSHARVEERARALLARRPYSPAICVTTPETVGRAAESVRYLLELGFRYVIFQVNYAAPWSDAALDELERQYWQMAVLYVELTRREHKFYLSPFDVKIATHVRGAEARGLLCKLGVRQVSVAPDGTLYPCVQFVENHQGGTFPSPLDEQSSSSLPPPRVARAQEKRRRFAIGDVWRGVDAGARDACFAETEAAPPECGSCAIADRCNRHCGCLNLQTGDGLGSPSGVLCEHERRLVPIADWIGETLWRERAPMFVHKHYNRGFAMLSLVEDRAAR